jgi:murein DD-endopeptidase MepM/ murein hydrolase activator NlpD
MTNTAFPLRLAALGVSVLALGACGDLNDMDFDLRGGAGQFDTSDAARNAVQSAPVPDARGVVSYPEYQVAVARRGDTVDSVAARIGIPAADLARHNAIPQNVGLREGEILALPVRVAEPGQAFGQTGGVDVASIAGNAIDRADGAPGLPAGSQPQRHQVQPGETAFSIARLYGVPVASLAEWNGLGADLALRQGQFLLIPTTAPRSDVQVAAIAPIEQPGAGSQAPLPPSAAAPLPTTDATPATTPAPAREAQPAQQTAASDTARLRMPVQGRIIRPFAKGKSEGIGISASAGTAVVAADNGTVAAITRDTDQVPILVIRHEGNLLTVYAGVDNIAVEKGDSVKRGQKIAVVRAANPPFLHFEVREGFESVDPTPYLN